jgi:pimeloyl-ACP methyl ester carboxylesterase
VIAWEESGAGAPIVFVHGISDDRHSWHSVVPFLDDGFRCIRLDLRGHGESSDADDYRPLAMADDVATVIREAGVDEPPVVVGHSLGGFVVTAYAAQATVRGVINVDQPLQLRDFTAALQSMAPQLLGPEFNETFAAITAGLGVDLLNPDDRAWADSKHKAARQEIVMGVWSTVIDSTPDELMAIVEAALPAIDAPYVAIHGSQPDPGYAAWLSSLVPSASVEVWDGDGHYLHLLEPERFATRLRSFIAS